MSLGTDYLPRWTIAAPMAAWAIYAVYATIGGAVLRLLLAAGLFASVLAAVHHAEVIAHKAGEPFGTFLFALAVTAIEIGLIVSIMSAGGPGSEALARDTVFATIMVILNGVVGICLLLGGLRHHEQGYVQTGVSAALAALAVLAVVTLVLPNYTTTAPRPYYSTSQLAFVGAAKAKGHDLDPAIAIGSRDAIREAVIRGLGIGYVSEAEFVPDPSLRAIAVSDAEIHTEAHVVELADRRHERLLRAFLELVGGLRGRR